MRIHRYPLGLAVIVLGSGCIAPKARPAPVSATTTSSSETRALREALRAENQRQFTVERALSEAHRAGEED